MSTIENIPSFVANASTSALETTTILIRTITARLNPDDSFSNISSTASSSTTTESFELPHIFNLFEDYPWLMWVVLVAMTLIVIMVVVTICYCIVHNKKKVIRQGSSQAIFDYDSPGSNCFPFRKHGKKLDDSHLVRQNSASNMSPYGRSLPLPPIRGQQLQKVRPETSPQPATLGINISTVKGFPEIQIPPESRRPLPPIRPKTT